MRKPAWLPHHGFGPVSENLNAALRHFSRLDPRERKGRRPRRPAGIDRPLHLHQWLHVKSCIGQTPMRRRRVRHREGREMHTGVAPHRRHELAAERGVRGVKQRFDIAPCKHGRGVAGAGEPWRAVGCGIDLNGDRRRGEAGADERAGRRFRIAYEMADMVEENLVGDGELAVRRGPCVLHPWTFSRSISLFRLRTVARAAASPRTRASSKHREDHGAMP